MGSIVGQTEQQPTVFMVFLFIPISPNNEHNKPFEGSRNKYFFCLFSVDLQQIGCMLYILLIHKLKSNSSC